VGNKIIDLSEGTSKGKDWKTILIETRKKKKKKSKKQK